MSVGKKEVLCPKCGTHINVPVSEPETGGLGLDIQEAWLDVMAWLQDVGVFDLLKFWLGKKIGKL